MKTNVTYALGILTIVFHKTNLVSRSKSALLLYGFERCSHRLHYGKCRTLEFWSLPHTTSQEVSDAPVCKMFNPGLVGGSQELDVNTRMFPLWFQTTLCFLLSRQRYMHTCTLKVKRCDTFFYASRILPAKCSFFVDGHTEESFSGTQVEAINKKTDVFCHTLNAASILTTPWTVAVWVRGVSVAFFRQECWNPKRSQLIYHFICWWSSVRKWFNIKISCTIT